MENAPLSEASRFVRIGYPVSRYEPEAKNLGLGAEWERFALDEVDADLIFIGTDGGFSDSQP
jgi:hypothetical protein